MEELFGKTRFVKGGRWAEYNVSLKSKSWPDSYSRDFNILTACWSSKAKKP
jgi:hypothetical protein